MTGSNELKTLMGQDHKSPAVRSWLTSADADGPRLKKGDTKAYVDLPASGMYLVFTDAAFFNRQRAAVGASPLLLTNVTFASGADPKYTPYSGELPFSLSFTDTRAGVRERLGEPGLVSTRRPLDRWTIDSLWLYVEYAADEQSIDNVSLQVPDPPSR